MRPSADAALTYTLLRLGSREIVQVRLAPIPQGNSFLYFVLAAVGIFTLLVGAWVRLRRPGDQSSLHFFWLTVAFFGVFTFSFTGGSTGSTGSSTGPTWWRCWPCRRCSCTSRWCSRSARGQRVRTPLGARLLPLLYLPALVMGSARVMAVARLDGNRSLLAVVAALDRLEPLYLGACLLGGLAVLVHALAHVRSVTARRQLRWIVWGTLLGGAPFALGYALPFALGVTPSVQAWNCWRCRSASSRWRSPRPSCATG